MPLQMKLVSSLEKVFWDEEPAALPPSEKPEGFRNELISFQAAYRAEGPEACIRLVHRVDSPLSGHIHVRSVRPVPVRLACMPGSGEGYLRKAPGLYPDLLREIRPRSLRAYNGQWDALWVDVEPGAEPGTYPLEIALLQEETGEVLGRVRTEVTVLPGELPPQTLMHTRWFHYDCLAHYYRVPVFSEEFWRITENFMRLAVRRGINMMLMPIHTPPLDTRVGGERLTVQLVDVYRDHGEYRFGFDRLRRWVEMAQRSGVEYFEAAHLFTQWGAKATPKIMAVADGRPERIFGWDVPADSEAYRAFLDAYLPALVRELKRLGIAERCRFHISDEPNERHLEAYRKARAMAAKHLDGMVIMDALSDIRFYESGAVTHPVPAIDHIEPFVAAGVPHLWGYYCLAQDREVSNTFMAMPAPRHRILGVQLYKYDLEGFLQWGYNFYGTQYSEDQVDPYAVTDGNGFSPAGDCYQVYPGEGGEPEESLRLMVTFHALQDLRALRLLESLIGRRRVLAMIEEGLPEPLTFRRYPMDSGYLPGLRRKVNQAILDAQG